MPNQLPEKEIIDVPPETPTPNAEKRGVQIVDARPIPESQPQKQSGNVIIGTLNVFNAPVNRYIGEPLRERYHKHYHPRHKHGRKHLIADIVLALTVVALLGVNVYAFFFSAPRLHDRVTMTIGVTPETLRSGDLVTITVGYENKNDEPLVDAALAILCPCTTQPVLAEPSDAYDNKTHTFRLGTIPSGGNGSVRFAWVYAGTVGTTQHFSAALSYGAEGRVVRETKSALWRAPVNDTALKVTVDAPDEIVHEGAASFVIRYENTSAYPIGNVRLLPSLGDHLRLLEVVPKLDQGAFVFPVLPAGGKGEIRGRVAFAGTGEPEASFIVKTFLGADAILQQEVERRMRVFYPKVRVEPIHDANAALSLGEESVLLFRYENGEDEDIRDLSITVDLPSSLFVADGKSLTVAKQQNPSLGLVRKGAKGEIAIAVRTKDRINVKEVFGNGDPMVRIAYQIRYRRTEAPDREIMVERFDDWKVNSDFIVDAFGKYYTPEGDQLGRGPLPPRVDETTRYWIFIPIMNTISDVQDVSVTATLAQNVEWTRKSSVTVGDALAYDERTRTITWRLAKVTKFSGGEYPDVGAALEVSLTPTVSQTGTEPVLLDAIIARGKDLFTGNVLLRSVAPVTTQLSVDQRAKDKGKVRN